MANVIVGGVFGLIAEALMESIWRRVGAGKVGVWQYGERKSPEQQKAPSDVGA